MKFCSDNQRRAVFARMNRLGVSLSPAEVVIRPTDYGDIRITGSTYGDLTSSDDKVPDWVTNVPKPVQEQGSNISSSADALLEYAPVSSTSRDTDIKIDVDKSDVLKQTDDLILAYAKSLPEKKKLVGATSVDDEYEISGPVKLQVRNRVKKDLDEILNVV